MHAHIAKFYTVGAQATDERDHFILVGELVGGSVAFLPSFWLRAARGPQGRQDRSGLLVPHAKATSQPRPTTLRLRRGACAPLFAHDGGVGAGCLPLPAGLVW